MSLGSRLAQAFVYALGAGTAVLVLGGIVYAIVEEWRSSHGAAPLLEGFGFLYVLFATAAATTAGGLIGLCRRPD
jgi:hypothetical protein